MNSSAARRRARTMQLIRRREILNFFIIAATLHLKTQRKQPHTHTMNTHKKKTHNTFEKPTQN